MKRTHILLLLAASLSSTAHGQSVATPKVPKKCIPQIASHGQFPKGPFNYKANESYKRSPIVKFQINEDGSVTSVKVVRSSGVGDIDNKMVEYVAKSKYKPRPAGCGVVESKGSITIDFD
jgi:TonB family protein